MACCLCRYRAYVPVDWHFYLAIAVGILPFLSSSVTLMYYLLQLHISKEP